MSRQRPWEDDPYHLFFTVEAIMVDREIDEKTQSMLRLLPRQPSVTSTSFAATMDDEGQEHELKKFVERDFDAWLYFENSGNREVGFRIPLEVWSKLAIPCYATCRSVDSVAVNISGDHVLVRFRLWVRTVSRLTTARPVEGGWSTFFRFAMSCSQVV